MTKRWEWPALEENADALIEAANQFSVCWPLAREAYREERPMNQEVADLVALLGRIVRASRTLEAVIYGTRAERGGSGLSGQGAGDEGRAVRLRRNAMNCDDLCSHAVAKAWDLGRTRKPRPDDSDTYRRFLHGADI